MSMLYRKGLIVIVLASLSLGFSWFNAQEEGSTNRQSTETQVPDQRPPVKIENTTQAYAAAREVPGTSIPKVPSNANTQAQQQSVDSAKTLETAAGENTIDDIQIIQIQKQINDIIRTNRRLRSKLPSQLEQIQQITEQAKIHRTVLKDLDASSSLQTNYSKSDIDVILKQEKLRSALKSAQTGQDLMKAKAEKS